MAKTNKYTSINFNDIYDKKTSSTSATATATTGKHHPFSSTTTHKSYSFSASSSSHGMLVLSRPSPKPISQPQSYSQSPSPSFPPISPALQTLPPLTDQAPAESDSISLRPLGKTGSGPSLSVPSPSQFPGMGSGEKVQNDLVQTSATPKSDKFVPPHLRPGFVAKEERPAAVTSVRGYRPGGGGGFGAASSPSRYGEDGRPKSGGGYGRRGFFESNDMNRPRSGGNRPSSSG